MLWVREKLAARSSGQCWKMQLAVFKLKCHGIKWLIKDAGVELTSAHSRTLSWKLKMLQSLFIIWLCFKLHKGNRQTPGKSLHARARQEQERSSFLSGFWFIMQRETKLKVNSVLLDNFSSLSSQCFHLEASPWRQRFSPKPGQLIRIPVCGGADTDTAPLPRRCWVIILAQGTICSAKAKRVSEGHFSMLYHTQHSYRHACKQKGRAGPSRGREGAEQKLRRQKGFGVMGNERKHNARWGEGRRRANAGKGGNKRKRREGGGQPGGRKRDCRVVVRSRQSAVLGGSSRTRSSAGTAQMDRSGLPGGSAQLPRR